MKKLLYTFIALTLVQVSVAQNTKKRVLFIGNSYTNANNLPQLIASVASSNGDTLFYDSNTPGGYTFELHSRNSTTLNKIAQANWDFVVLQEQSQLPSFPNSQVQTSVFPFAKKLDSSINVANSCTETMFYMTWGRKNGDANNCPFFTPLCTYEGMDSMLYLRYSQMANMNAAVLSPVGALWRYIRNNHPAINLYSADESHPSLAGSYAAACSFYAAIFRKSPMNISFNSTLNSADAALIKAAAKAVVYDSLMKWNIGRFDNKASFSSNQNQSQVSFQANSPFMPNHAWDFGDGTTDIVENPSHNYTSNGTYTVTHTVVNCGQTFVDTKSITVISIGLEEKNREQQFKFYPNPVQDQLKVEFSEEAVNRVKIYTINGQVKLNNTYGKGLQTINLTDFDSGIYFIEFQTESGHLIRKKLIKVGKD
ncbi:MAG: T9SS type A sorting domain-containing protein [Flavobacteriales bacterium]|nr:T9SS type A sorting domain-containing protein [Flavobacteriales bacterium]